MLCSNCGHDNPSDNRFCGNCGVRLERIPVPQREGYGDAVRQRLGSPAASQPAPPASQDSVSQPYDKLPLKPLHGRKVEFPYDEQAEAPQNGNSPDETPEKPRTQRAVSGPSFLNLEVPTEPPKEEQTISGPSFLGLADEGRYNIDYLLEEEPKESHWRMWLVLIILGLFGVMAWLQLRHSGLNVAGLMQRLREAKLGTVQEQTHPTTGSADAAPVETDKGTQQPPQAASSSNPSSAAPAAGASNAVDQTKSASGAQPEAPDKSAGAATPADHSNSTQKSDSSAPGSPASATPAVKQAASADSKAADTSSSDKSSAADESSTTADQRTSASDEPATSKSVTTAKSTAPKKPSAAVDDSEARAARAENAQGAAFVANGEKYLYGRGVRQNCERAISYLRKAADMGNAKGSSHLGAMYATGQCLPMDRVRAYKYFAQALHQDNTNPYFQQNLEMLWNEMTPDEKQQATARTPAAQ